MSPSALARRALLREWIRVLPLRAVVHYTWRCFAMSARTTLLPAHYRRIRQMTADLCASLSPEDCQAQSMPDASPAKWHLAHTSWFFETFVLEAVDRHYSHFHPAYRVLFNSYYQTVGAQHPRPQRGLLTRP